MFESIDKLHTKNSLSFTFDGQSIAAKPDMSVAAALLNAGVFNIRVTPVSQSIRGPFCMMGACYDCLVLVDGITVQACLTQVKDGMVVNRVPLVDMSKDIS